MASRLTTEEQHTFTRARHKAQNKQPVDPKSVLVLIDTVSRLARELRATEKVSV